MKYDFSKITLTDLDEKPLTGQPFYKDIWRLVYFYSQDLDLVEKAREINKGKVVELDKNEVNVITELVNSEKSWVFAFAKKAYVDYIASVK